jgi:hypothetical protein
MFNNTRRWMTSVFIPYKLMKIKFHMTITTKLWPMKFVMHAHGLLGNWIGGRPITTFDLIIHWVPTLWKWPSFWSHNSNLVRLNFWDQIHFACGINHCKTMKLIKSFTIFPMNINNQFLCMTILNKTSFKNKFQTMVLIYNISHRKKIFLETWII